MRGGSRCARGAWGACAGEVGPAAEGCDGVDEDCDGAVDEGVAVACGSDVGICAAGVRRCVDGALGVCDAAVLPGAQAEACRAGAEDEDCDGSVDEGCGCINGETRACGLAVGRCRAGMQTCAGGMWGGCFGAVPPAAETCDGSDEDCDGATDEGFDVGAACSAGVGLCRRDGARVCSGGVGVCGVMPGPAAEESCDGLDQDCDGRVDEGLPPFVTSELRIGAGVATVGPVVAAVGGQYAVARVERLGLDIGLPGGRRGVGVAFNAYDVRGRPVAADVMLASDLNAVAALAMTAFDNAGDAGYAVFFATTSRDVGVDGDGYTISAVVVFPGRMAEVSEVLPLVTLPNAVTSLGAAASDRGIGLTWATASIEPRVGFGFIDFRVEPPMLAPVNVTQSADGATIAWDGTRFVVGWRASMPLLRGAAIRLAAIDGNRPGPAVTLVEAESVGVPRLVAGGGQVHAVWHAEGRVGAPQVFVGSAEMARGTVSRPVAVSPDGLPALDPAIAYGAAGVGVAWVDAREGEDETEVYFRRLSGGVQRGWQVVGEPIVVSRGVGVSGPVDAAAGSAFAVTWYDARPESPGVYLSTGPLGCVPAAIQ
ncbi:MAG: putative metal-binding motif-containing protein [Myxococcales bacterium]|nr:putative metal-binding motif-containing protein [Myxococcales bacterium]